MTDTLTKDLQSKFEALVTEKKAKKWNAKSKRLRSALYPKRASDFVPGLYDADGNVYFLAGIARRLCRQHNMNEDFVVAEMNSGDENTMIEVFDKYFTGLISEHSFPSNKR